MTRTHDVLSERRESMLDTKQQQAYIASLYSRLGFCYIVGWKDVRGYGVCAVKRVEWLTPEQRYINLRDS